MKLEESLFRVIDTETTGFDAPKDRIVEIGTCDVFGPGGTWTQSPPLSWLVNPGIPIPPTAKAVHHILDSMVKDAGSSADVIAKLMPQRDASAFVFVAHNAQFDRGFLEAEGFPVGARWLCTWRLAMHVWPECPSYKNEVLRYWLGYDELPWASYGPSHRAAHDVSVTALILREALKRLATHSPFTSGPMDVDVLIAWAESPVVLKGLMGFGKHHDWTWSECAQKDPDYLDWILRGDERKWDLDKWHTAKHHRGRLV